MNDAKILRVLSYVFLFGGIGWAIANAVFGIWTTPNIIIPGGSGLVIFGLFQGIAAIVDRLPPNKP
ncbi:MAG TPA: hypothetical protein VK638_52975 [Edaphobacter sp.]|nr:hypothetical protein [Edaphobacter sp.]